MPEQASPPSALEQQQRDVIVSIARGAPLHAVLERLVGLMELLTPNGYGTVLMLDPDGIHTRHGAAPHIAPAFARAIDGACIGPHEGSCGAAAYLKRRIIVEDIATHPNWTKYREVALAAGLRACWSTPIFGADGVVLGTFAIYYTEPRRPTQAEIAGIDLATYLASIALERERTQASLRAGEQLYRLVYESVADIIFQIRVEPDGRFRFAQVNPAFAATTGLAREAVVDKYVEEVLPPSAHALVSAAYRTAIDERRSVSWEEISEYPSGRMYDHVQVYPVFDALGVCSELIGTVHDVTAYKLAADKIAAQASLLDQARDA
ncbi:MAG TPA: GAF domain-containing protein, partial [Polyangiales bacterium]